MTHDDFRRIALGMKDAVESAHMGHPDFRVGNRIFATLHADNEWGMVILTPDQQQRFMAGSAEGVRPRKGRVGTSGMHRGTARRGGRGLLGEAMTLAWRNRVEKSAAGSRRSEAPRAECKTQLTRTARLPASAGSARRSKD